MTDKTPNPGSEEAKKQGCLCPRIDNNYGKGSGYGDGLFWTNLECPLHGKEQDVSSLTNIMCDVQSQHEDE